VWAQVVTLYALGFALHRVQVGAALVFFDLWLILLLGNHFFNLFCGCLGSPLRGALANLLVVVAGLYAPGSFC
jgi:hypothetical protein